MNSLDEIDRHILELLEVDGRLTGAEIGRRVGLSQPAASSRIQRLEKNGIIRGYRAVVDPSAIGLNIHAVVRLRTTHAQLANALKLASKTSEIASVVRVTGEDCLLFDIHCPDAGRLEQIVDSLAHHGPVITSLVLHRYPPKPLVTALLLDVIHREHRWRGRVIDGVDVVFPRLGCEWLVCDDTLSMSELGRPSPWTLAKLGEGREGARGHHCSR